WPAPADCCPGPRRPTRWPAARRGFPPDTATSAAATGRFRCVGTARRYRVRAVPDAAPAPAHLRPWAENPDRDAAADAPPPAAHSASALPDTVEAVPGSSAGYHVPSAASRPPAPRAAPANDTNPG